MSSNKHEWESLLGSNEYKSLKNIMILQGLKPRFVEEIVYAVFKAAKGLMQPQGDVIQSPPPKLPDPKIIIQDRVIEKLLEVPSEKDCIDFYDWAEHHRRQLAIQFKRQLTPKELYYLYKNKK